MTEATLAGRRVLLVEDEVLVATLVETALEDENCTVVGPYHSLREALEAARAETFDLAVLDINLAGEMIFPVAEVLEGRGVPFLLLSGYGEAGLPHDRQHWPICGKPFSLRDLVSALERMLVTPLPRSGSGRDA
jgi:DNA-binding NtrC family response regulator